MDIFLDKETNDALFINGQVLTTFEDTDVVAQRLSIRLLTFKGEYGFDLNFGVPYWQRILGFKIPKSDVDYIYQQEILKEERVKEITFFESTLTNKVYSVNFRVLLTSGNETGIITVTPTV
jgi:hypothetical protein